MTKNSFYTEQESVDVSGKEATLTRVILHKHYVVAEGYVVSAAGDANDAVWIPNSVCRVQMQSEHGIIIEADTQWLSERGLLK